MIAEDALRKAGVSDERITQILDDQSKFEYFYGSVMAVGTKDDGTHTVWVEGWGSEATGKRVVLKLNFPRNKPAYLSELVRVQNNQFTQQVFVEFTYQHTGPEHGKEVVIGDKFDVFSLNTWALTDDLPSGLKKFGQSLDVRAAINPQSA